MWLSGLGISLQHGRSLVPFLVRAHAWAVGSVPGQQMYERRLVDVPLSHGRLFPPLSAPCSQRTAVTVAAVYSCVRHPAGYGTHTHFTPELAGVSVAAPTTRTRERFSGTEPRLPGHMTSWCQSWDRRLGTQLGVFSKNTRKAQGER